MSEERDERHEDAANDAELNDPFWSAFRERHPDVNVVLVPDAPDADDGRDSNQVVEADPSEVITIPVEFDAWFQTLVTNFVGEEPIGPARWVAGDEPDLLDRESTCIVDDVDEKVGLSIIDVAQRELGTEGWTGIRTTTGMPRVLASSELAGKERQVQVVYAPAAQRLIITGQWMGFRVGESAAEAELAAGR